MGGTRTPGRYSRLRALGAGSLALALALFVAACGGNSDSGTNEAEGKFEVEVVKSQFPAEQHLGQTSLMKIAVRNSGDRAIESLTMTISIAGEEGETSSLPFGVHDPQPELAQPDRPVWVLAEGYPRVGSSKASGGAETASRKVFDFNELEPGQTVEAVWKLSAVRQGEFEVTYRVGAGLNGKAKAETAAGEPPKGAFEVEISNAATDVEVTDSGEIVEIGKGGKSDDEDGNSGKSGK